MPLFFSYLCGGECLEDINTLVGHFRQKAWYSILSPFRKSKTSDFFEVNIRTFDAKHPYFCPKKSDVLQLPALHLSSLKKNFGFCVNLGDRHVLAWLINLSDNHHIN